MKHGYIHGNTNKLYTLVNSSSKNYLFAISLNEFWIKFFRWISFRLNLLDTYNGSAYDENDIQRINIKYTLQLKI